MPSGCSSGTQDSDTSSWTSEDEEEEEEWEEEREEEEARTAAARRKRKRTATAAAAAAAAGTAAGTNAESAEQAPPAVQHRQRPVHKPYSHLLACEIKFTTNPLLISCQLCTDLPALRCPGSEGTCAVQVSVVVHPPGWDDSEGWDYIEQQEYPTPAQQQQQAADWQVLGPIQTTLKHYKDGRVACQKLPRDGKLTPYNQEDYTLVLQERVSCSRQYIKLSCTISLLAEAMHHTNMLCMHSRKSDSRRVSGSEQGWPLSPSLVEHSQMCLDRCDNVVCR
jgi:hypothetical protein